MTQRAEVTQAPATRSQVEPCPPLEFAVTASPGPVLGSHDPMGQDAMARIALDGINQVRLPALDHAELESRTPGSGPLLDTIRAVQKQLDWALRAGTATGRDMRVAVNLGELSNLQPRSRLAPWLDYVVERFKDHPALGVWKFFDEPNNPYIPYPRLVEVRRGLHAAYRRVHELDGRHPVWISQAPKPRSRISPRFLGTYAGAADIHAIDLYPISDPPGKHADIPNKHPSGVGDYEDRLSTMIRTYGDRRGARWTWMIIQGAGWSGVLDRDSQGRHFGSSQLQPTPHLLRYMAHQSILHGACGLVIFGMNVGLYPDMQPYGWDWGYWEGVVVPLLRELRSSRLADALSVGQDSVTRIHRLGEGRIRIDTRELQGSEGRRLLLASRSERQGGEPFEVGVRVPFDAPHGETADVLFEDRSVNIRGGAAEDAFLPHDVHIYCLEPH